MEVVRRGLIAALYVQAGGVYAARPGVDAWCSQRDARGYPGPYPVVAHPPCRAWGKYAYKSKHTSEERDLALHALACVRAYGGVLEHPVGSALWRHAMLPRPGERDAWGFTLRVNQCDFGHRALKPTLLYIVGLDAAAMPQLPASRVPETTVENMWRGEREATPKAFADFLCEIATRAAENF